MPAGIGAVFLLLFFEKVSTTDLRLIKYLFLLELFAHTHMDIY